MQGRVKGMVEIWKGGRIFGFGGMEWDRVESRGGSWR